MNTNREHRPNKDSQEVRLEKIKAYILNYWHEKHFSPAIREIAQELSISTGMMHRYILLLEEQGWLEKHEHNKVHGPATSRTIVPVELFMNKKWVGGIDFATSEDATTVVIKEEDEFRWPMLGRD